MRKLLAFALLALFGFSFVSPLLAATSTAATLPACCRKAAGHHCMSMQNDENGTASHTEFRMRMDHCPCCGVLGGAVAHIDVLSFTTFSHAIAPRSTRSGLHPQTSPLVLGPVAGGNEMRGPPTSFTA